MTRRDFCGLAVAALTLFAGCDRGPGEEPLRIPHGYMSRLGLTLEGHRYGFGPFVGYYFRPRDASDPTRLAFVCFNEGGFYASDAPHNALLFEGEAVLTRLPPAEPGIPGTGDRIRPVFFRGAPESWLATRPDPRDEFVHFHSCYDAQGATLVGYWLRHDAKLRFTYDMGARVGPGSPLYHRSAPGPDRDFARIVEFDNGPGDLP